MLELMGKYKKGTEVQFGDNKAIITSGLIRFKEFYAIYADIIENIDDRSCCVFKIHDKVALIMRDKKILLKMRIKCRRKKSHILS